MEIVEKNKFYTIAIAEIQQPKNFKNILSNFYLEHVNKIFKNEQRKAEYLTTLYLIYRCTGIQQLYQYNEYQKPFCSSTGHTLSISHSEKFSVIMITKNGKVGIDIEEKHRNLERISQKFINDAESRWIKNNDDLIKIWTAKEALYKMIDNSSPNFKDDYVVYKNSTAIVLKPIKKKLPLHSYRNDQFFLTWTFEQQL